MLGSRSAFPDTEQITGWRQSSYAVFSRQC